MGRSQQIMECFFKWMELKLLFTKLLQLASYKKTGLSPFFLVCCIFLNKRPNPPQRRQQTHSVRHPGQCPGHKPQRPGFASQYNTNNQQFFCLRAGGVRKSVACWSKIVDDLIRLRYVVCNAGRFDEH